MITIYAHTPHDDRVRYTCDLMENRLLSSLKFSPVFIFLSIIRLSSFRSFGIYLSFWFWSYRNDVEFIFICARKIFLFNLEISMDTTMTSVGCIIFPHRIDWTVRWVSIFRYVIVFKKIIDIDSRQMSRKMERNLLIGNNFTTFPRDVQLVRKLLHYCTCFAKSIYNTFDKIDITFPSIEHYL